MDWFDHWPMGRTPVVHKDTYLGSKYYPTQGYISEEIHDWNEETGVYEATGYMPMRGSRLAMNGGRQGLPKYHHPLDVLLRYVRRYVKYIPAGTFTIGLAINMNHDMRDLHMETVKFAMIRRIESKFNLYSQSTSAIERAVSHEIYDGNKDFINLKGIKVCVSMGKVFLTNDPEKIEAFDILWSESFKLSRALQKM